MQNSTTPNPGVLFTPTKLGAIELANRLVMSPLTRDRARRPGDVPGEMNAEYYAQRATAGMIVTEGTQVSPQGKGYIDTPGIYDAEQVAGWKLVTSRVHAEGGKIVAQLWHVGRMSHPSLQPNGALPVAPSALAFKAQVFAETGMVDCVTPRALEANELPGIVEDFRRAAQNAVDAGFDGVEIHGANGYLIDQFLKSKSNVRTDEYGGSVENRLRFPLEIVDAVVDVLGSDRVGIRIAPQTRFGDVEDAEPMVTFGAFVDALGKRELAFLDCIEGQTGGKRSIPGVDYGELKRRFGGPYLANNGYSRDLAIEALASGRADAVVFGRAFLANPDLVERFRENAPLNEPDQSTFYGGDAHGYTDYPTLEKASAAK